MPPFPYVHDYSTCGTCFLTCARSVAQELQQWLCRKEEAIDGDFKAYQAQQADFAKVLLPVSHPLVLSRSCLCSSFRFRLFPVWPSSSLLLGPPGC